MHITLEHETTTEVCRHEIKFVLIFAKIDPALDEICTVALLRHLSDQTGIHTGSCLEMSNRYYVHALPVTWSYSN